MKFKTGHRYLVGLSSGYVNADKSGEINLTMKIGGVDGTTIAQTISTGDRTSTVQYAMSNMRIYEPETDYTGDVTFLVTAEAARTTVRVYRPTLFAIQIS